MAGSSTLPLSHYSRGPAAGSKTFSGIKNPEASTSPQPPTPIPSFIQQKTTNVNTGQCDQLPSFWSSLKTRNTSLNQGKSWRGLVRGWRLVVFDSWINLLLLFIPISWALNLADEKSHSAIFALSILGLVPLVKLHDLCTRDLAIRIGGSKTGLLNASLSNLVEIVVAISALRRCELRVVQSSLVGSVLSKLLLVLGLCFFAGGMRFSEQGFDATATQMHCSLMSISVGAILLPAAYHFTLEDRRGDKDTPVPQGRNILHMSHGVSIVLLFIYSAYLLFQLWSHKHLYHDKHNKKSQRLPVQVRVVPKTANVFKNAGKKIATSFSTLDLSKPMQSPYPETCIALEPRSYAQTHFSPYGSQLTLNELPEAAGADRHTLVDYPGASTVHLVSSPDDATLTREQSRLSDRSSFSIAPTATMSFEDLGDESRLDDDQCNPVKEPHLSWTVTLTLMVIVTIVVAITAESLVESMDGISTAISKEWIGLILLPSVSAVAECITAVNVSVRDELTLSVSVAVGSSIQTTLFVFPFMVILAWITHKPLSLLLDPFQSLVLYLSVQIMNYVVADGKSNWLEGVILICLYVIVAVSFWFYPGSNLPAALAHCVAADLI